MEPNEHLLKNTERLATTKNLSNDRKQAYNVHVNNLFKKRFVITNNECYTLPEPKEMFKDSLWTIDRLQTLKNELNSVKNCLNNYDLDEWQIHTKQRNSAKDVMNRLRKDIQPEFLTQAWCKFYEIVSSFPLVPMNYIHNCSKRFKSIHLCEAPGAFVVSLNHWIQTNIPNIEWDWIATTLNPYYEGNSPSVMIDDDRFIRYTLSHWCFGEDNTGNLMNLSNLDKLIESSKPHNEIFLITADGSIDCSDVPGEQETIVGQLHFCETIAALHLLNTGGSFVLKIFTIFECRTVCLIYLLSCCFNQVCIIKPATSKEGNSEMYVVCTDFKGPTFASAYLNTFREYYEHEPKQAMFSKEDIPCAFIEKIIECNEFFKSQQCLVIMNNILAFKSGDTKVSRDIKEIQRMVADKYIKDYNLHKLTSGEIVGKLVLEGTNSINLCKRALQGSYNERCKRQHLTPWDRLQGFFNDSNKIKIGIPSDEFVKFKCKQLPEDLEISCGKPFQKVYNSRFCSESILKIQNGVDNILANIGYKMQFPTTESINTLTNETLTQSEYKTLIFHYTDSYDSYAIITQIYDALINLNSGETLVLIGYSLLTHLNVGLFYLLSYAFNCLKLKLCNDMGSIIILEHYNYNLKIVKHLLDINATSCDAQRKGKAIFGIIPASFLYECDLFLTIVDVNHWVIKSYVHYIFNTLERDKFNKESNT
ncbi:cap-specific mRNA (nucleoside-2'-O-)-methyltransferase 2-like isoform X1 [Calliopsis andreniformis]|uniref:cap-specific mRNA (nucleoside-2'-O-)-methyltransferase 2-like isoform X1 n=1 Tax=Calliopsis andreniformis TaxID=337506 RepID=UPI003FCC57BE